MAERLIDSGSVSTPSTSGPSATSEVSCSVRGSTMRRHKSRPGNRSRSAAPKVPTSSSSRISSDTSLASANDTTITCCNDGAFSFFLRAVRGALLMRRLGRRIVDGGRLVQVEDLRRAHVGLGLVAGDAADLAHDLGHAL